MSRTRFILSAVFAILLLSALVFGLLHSMQPRYQGKTIIDWLGQLEDNLIVTDSNADGGDQIKKSREARDAIRAIGPKAIPYIMAEVRLRNSKWNRTYRDLLSKLPPRIQNLLPTPRDGISDSTATAALCEFGESAKPALTKGLRDHNPDVRIASAGTLGELARHKKKRVDIKESIPGLIKCLQDPDPRVRYYSAGALGAVGPDAVSAVPDLALLLEDQDVGYGLFIRYVAARSLGEIGPGASNALPALRSVLNDVPSSERIAAAIAIWRIDFDTNTLPVMLEELTQGLTDSLIMADLGGPEGLTNAIIKIDPEAAARAGLMPTPTEGLPQ